MPFLTVRDGETYYEWITEQSGERTDRPVLVFLHGWGGSARYWRSTAEALSDRYDCLIYDLRGFGRSKIVAGDEPIAYSLKSYGEDLDALLTQLQVDRLSVIAHSMGCSIATYLLETWGDRPDRQIDRCILTCGGVFKFNALIFGVFYQFGQLVINFRPPWFYRLPGMDFLVMQRFLHRPIPASDRQEFIEDYLGATADAAIGTLLSVANAQTCTDISNQIAHLKIPTLVLSCDRDTIVPASLGRAAAALNPSLKYQVLKKVGHFPMLEDSENFLIAVRDFFEMSI
jgi:pimeloyl-ACP methyl ester carboxylesterase